MIIYSVTCHVEIGIAEEWVSWMKGTHIPEVLETNLFVSHKFCEVMVDEPDNIGKSFNIQYELESMGHLDIYNEKHAPALKQKTLERYGEKCLAFRTILKGV
jgi:hypothetical protein